MPIPGIVPAGEEQPCVNKALREKFTPARTEQRITKAIEADLKSPQTIASIQRSRRQMLRGEGRNWREIYFPQD